MFQEAKEGRCREGGVSDREQGCGQGQRGDVRGRWPTGQPGSYFDPQRAGRTVRGFCRKGPLCPTSRHGPAGACTRNGSFLSTEEGPRSKGVAQLVLFTPRCGLEAGGSVSRLITHPDFISLSTLVVTGAILRPLPRPHSAQAPGPVAMQVTTGQNPFRPRLWAFALT